MKRSIIGIISLTIFYRCIHAPDESKTVVVDQEIGINSDTLLQSSCPYLTKDNQKNIVLSWIKELTDTTAVLCYAVSKDNGQSFGKETEILPSRNIHPHGENLPKILFKPSGEIIAMWGSANPNPNSKYSGLVFYSQSFDDGKSWSPATQLVKDTSAYDQRYFDLELLPSGEAIVIWLDNRGEKDKEGSTLFCAVTYGNRGFQDEKPIGETCCPCCRTDVFTDSKGNIHVAYRDIIQDTIRDMVHQVSTDAGKTFSLPQRISADNWVINGCPHTGPTLTENKHGLHFAWYTMGNGEGVFYASSKDNGKSFSLKDSVSGSASAKHPQICSLPNGNSVIVWDQSQKDGDRFFNYIGLQLRDDKGLPILKKFISKENVVSEFPVIKPLNKETVFVAYNCKINGRKNVFYQTVSLK